MATIQTTDSTAATLDPLERDLPEMALRPAVPAGFAVGGSAVGIKSSGRPDLCLVRVLEPPAAVAMVATTNTVPAAPVRLNRRHLHETGPAGNGRFGWVDAVVSTSGSANAGTGTDGDRDQEQIAAALAEAVGAETARTLSLSTGLIGTRLPVDRVVDGIRALVGSLGTSADDLERAARGLMTTDTKVKIAGAEVGDDERRIHVVGFAKGVGMIHPRMATMLAILLTDARLEPPALDVLLRPIVARTWNQLTVDGDTSTNDTVLLLASGASGQTKSRAADVARCVEAVARSLARQQAADGEGAQTLLTCQVSGGRDQYEARAVARAVVSSSLVKAAIHGRDPNWGRVLAAAGNGHLPDAAVLEAAGMEPEEAARRAGSPVPVDAGRLRIGLCGVPVFAAAPLPFDEPAVAAAMDAEEVLVRLDLGAGNGTGEAFGCDLTETYVVENSAYTT